MLKFSEYVEPDLEEIAAWIAEDNPVRAIRLIKELRRKIDEVGEQPQLYQLRPDVGEGARLATFGQYVILFQTIGKDVFIERVVHGARNLSELH